MNFLITFFIVSIQSYPPENEMNPLKSCSNKIKIDMPKEIKKGEEAKIKWSYQKPQEWEDSNCQLSLYSKKNQQKLYQSKQFKNVDEVSVTIPKDAPAPNKELIGQDFMLFVVCQNAGKKDDEKKQGEKKEGEKKEGEKLCGKAEFQYKD